MARGRPWGRQEERSRAGWLTGMVAAARLSTYLKDGPGVRAEGGSGETMSAIVSSMRSPVAWAGIGMFGLLLAAAASLWAYYGTAVFFEVIRSGIAACF